VRTKRDAQARLGLAGRREAVVDVAAHSQVEQPVAGLDLVLDVESQFLDIGVAGIAIQASAAGEIVGRKNRLVSRVHGDGALGGIGISGHRISAGIHAGRVIDGIDDAQVVVLAQEGLAVLRTGLERVDSPGVGNIRVDCGVGEGAVLGDG